MRPSLVLLGFVLGSATSITFSLAGVTVVYIVLRGEYPRVAAELPTMVMALAMFAALTGLAALSFYGQLKRCAWRGPAIASLLAGLAWIGWQYWPQS